MSHDLSHRQPLPAPPQQFTAHLVHWKSPLRWKKASIPPASHTTLNLRQWWAFKSWHVRCPSQVAISRITWSAADCRRPCLKVYLSLVISHIEMVMNLVRKQITYFHEISQMKHISSFPQQTDGFDVCVSDFCPTPQNNKHKGKLWSRSSSFHLFRSLNVCSH